MSEEFSQQEIALEESFLPDPEPEEIPEPGFENNENKAESAGEAMLDSMELTDTRLDIEGSLRLGETWDDVKDWATPAWDQAKQAFQWAKAPSTTYPEAVAKAAIFSAGTTVFLSPVFLARNCYQVYKSRQTAGTGQFRAA